MRPSLPDPHDDLLANVDDSDDDLQQLLAARPPRRRRRPSLTTALGATILLVLGFAAGVAVQQARTPPPFEPLPTEDAAAQGGGDVVGTVSARDGMTLFVTTADGSVVEVVANDATTVDVFSPGSLDDVDPGAQVTVIGVRQPDGTVVATTISEGAPTPR